MMADHRETILSNGTWIVVGPDWVMTRLPNGRVVNAAPEPRSLEMAHRLGYGDDVAALTRDHDTLHSLLTSALGFPYSFSLMQAAGCEVDPHIAAVEEDAVLTCQRLRQAVRAAGFVC